MKQANKHAGTLLVHGAHANSKFLAITTVSLSLAVTSFAAIVTTGSPGVPPPGRLLVGHNATNSVEINGGSTVASDGDDFGGAAYVGVDGAGNGTLVVTGAGSAFTTTATNSLRVGANSGTATGLVTIDNGGLVAVGKDLHLGSGGGTNTGFLNILGGSTLTVTTNAFLGRGGTNNHGEINITGTGNTLTIGGNTFMNNSGGTGSLLVESGNTVSFGSLFLQGSDVGSGLAFPSGAGTIDLSLTDWSTWDPIDITGSLNLNSGGGSHLLVSSPIDPTGGMFSLGDTIDLITYASLTGANFDTVGDSFSTGKYDFLIGQDSDSVFLQVTAVPEPSSTALLGLGGLALILRRRR